MIHSGLVLLLLHVSLFFVYFQFGWWTYMTGMNKLTEKEKRAQRRRNHIARDLATTKYHQRVIDRKRNDGEEGNFFADRYYEDEVDW